MITSLKDYKPQGNQALGVVIFVLFWVGLILTFFAMDLYDSICMPLSLAILLWILPGFIITPFLYNAVPSQKLKGAGKFIVLLISDVIAFGGIVLYVVLAIDYYNAKDVPLTVKSFPVKEYSYNKPRGSRVKTPLATISYQEHLKTLSFTRNTMEDTLNYRHVELKTVPGALGYDVIRSERLMR